MTELEALRYRCAELEKKLEPTDAKIDAMFYLLDQYANGQDRYYGLPIASPDDKSAMRRIVRDWLQSDTPSIPSEKAES